MIDSEYLLQVCSAVCVLVTSKQKVTFPVSKLIEMTIKGGHFYVILGIVKAILVIHYCSFPNMPLPQNTFT